MKLTDLIEEYNEVKNSYKKKFQDNFKIIFREFFDKSPDVNVITWTQYTPYFDDGDPCVFSAKNVTASNATLEEADEIHYAEYYGDNDNVWIWPQWNYSQNTKKKPPYKVDFELFDEIQHFIEYKDVSEILLNTFGDHCKIIATRDGFTVKEHQHD